MTTASAFRYIGVNLSGAEFGSPLATQGQSVIGVYGQEYTYPTASEVDYYAGLGFNVIRVPFTWERLQPRPLGPLDPAQLGYLDGLVGYATNAGLSVVLDPHNYGYGYGKLVGNNGTPAADFADLWSKLAAHFKQPGIIFGLMNEPNRQTPADWVQPVNAAIAAIRHAGAKQLILVPGTAWSGGSTWVSSGNAHEFAPKIIDPQHNMAFEIHQYSDADGSGRSAAIASPNVARERLTAVTAWAQQGGKRLFLAEFGAGSDAASIANLQSMLGFMQQHADVWLGGTAWAGGPWWPSDYVFALDPTNGVTKPQLTTLASYAPKAGA